MARKNLFEVNEPLAERPAEPTPAPLGRPLLGLERPLRPASPVGAISQSLETINERSQRADEIEKKLSAGLNVVELDPALIEGSFIVDRLGVDPEDQAALVAQIREHGQQVPILVRPHPDRQNHYQVAYGHRRLAALRELGLPVRAVVRDLTDEQLVVSQGQENNARTDLTFIERCFFASRLEARGFAREIIMSALGVDKAALSRMIALTARLPSQLIEAIGSAPSFGRQRWAELADLLEVAANSTKALKLVSFSAFRAKKSDERFQKLYDELKAPAEKQAVKIWESSTGIRPVRISETDRKVTFAFDKRVASDFALFVEKRLESLFDEYQAANKKTGD